MYEFKKNCNTHQTTQTHYIIIVLELIIDYYNIPRGRGRKKYAIFYLFALNFIPTTPTDAYLKSKLLQ